MPKRRSRPPKHVRAAKTETAEDRAQDLLAHLMHFQAVEDRKRWQREKRAQQIGGR